MATSFSGYSYAAGETADEVRAFLDAATPAARDELDAAVARGADIDGGILLAADTRLGVGSSGAVDWMTLADFEALIGRMPKPPDLSFAMQTRAVVANVKEPAPPGTVRVAILMMGLPGERVIFAAAHLERMLFSPGGEA